MKILSGVGPSVRIKTHNQKYNFTGLITENSVFSANAKIIETVEKLVLKMKGWSPAMLLPRLVSIRILKSN